MSRKKENELFQFVSKEQARKMRKDMRKIQVNFLVKEMRFVSKKRILEIWNRYTLYSDRTFHSSYEELWNEFIREYWMLDECVTKIRGA